MKQFQEQDVTVITPFYNTYKPYFEFYIKSFSKFKKLNILIGDDGSSSESKKMLKDMTRPFPNIKIITFEENRGMCRTLLDLANHVNTPFVIKIDSDDGLYRLPTTNTIDFDAVVVQKSSIDMVHYLSYGGLGPTGTLYRTEVFKKIYRDAEYMDIMEPWLHEDVFMHLNLLTENYKLVKDIGDTPVFERYSKYYKPHTMTYKKRFDKRCPKMETFLLWCIYYKKDPDFYYDILIKIRQKLGV